MVRFPLLYGPIKSVGWVDSCGTFLRCVRGDMFQRVCGGFSRSGSRNVPTRGPLAIANVWGSSVWIKVALIRREIPKGSCCMRVFALVYVCVQSWLF